MWRSRLETAALATALLLCVAFAASFLFGLRGDPAPVVTSSARPPHQEAPDRSLGRLEVLNASGRSGLARAATDRLRQAGFDVVYFGNAGAAAGDTSVVVARTGDDAVARAAARQLGIGRVDARPDTTLFIDATVIIGGDWRNAPSEPEEDRPDTWRARASRWLRPG